MLRLSPPGFTRFTQASQFDVIYGGGESNVAVSLAMFGMPVQFVSRIPANDIGESAVGELRKRGVGIDFLIRGGDRLGIYFLEMGAVSRSSNVIYDRSFSGMATIEKGMVNWEKVFDKAKWFHWTGITPAISQGAADVCLEAVRKASEMGLIVSCDLNYRAKLWKYGKASSDIMPDLVKECDIILGNEEDAEKHFGIHPEGVDVTQGHTLDSMAYESVCRQVMARFPKCKKVIVTLRGSLSASHNTWSGILYNGKLLSAPTYQITHIVDRVGGGDSFMAGLIYGLIHFDGDDQKALEFAVAASALKHTIFGDANLVTVKEVKKIMGGDVSGRVSR